MTWLLDGGVLVALAIDSHVHHHRAHEWFGSLESDLFATCPLTQGTLLRMHMRSAADQSAAAAWRALQAVASHPRHAWWDDALSFLDVPHRHLQGSAQVTLVAEADARRFHELRTELASRHESALGFRISYNDLLIRICAHALREHPRANSSLDGDAIRLHEVVNVGLAIEVGGDLVVANVKHADRKSLVEIASDLRGLVERAHANKLDLDDITGGTFTISNLGVYGIDAFTPVLNPPESAILGVGALREKAVARDGEVAAELSMTLSLTFDHRIIDGAPAARFLARIRELIEQPYLLL